MIRDLYAYVHIYTYIDYSLHVVNPLEQNNKQHI